MRNVIVDYSVRAVLWGIIALTFVAMIAFGNGSKNPFGIVEAHSAEMPITDAWAPITLQDEEVAIAEGWPLDEYAGLSLICSDNTIPTGAPLVEDGEHPELFCWPNIYPFPQSVTDRMYPD